MRITMPPEKRKEQLADIAERLFATLGYDQVRVSDIVKEAKVAQGTFYYHFKTKEDLLYFLLENKIKGMVTFLEEIATNSSMTLIDRLTTILSLLLSPLPKENSLFVLMGHAPPTLHHQLDAIRRKLVAPLISDLVNQGSIDGTFRRLDHPVIISQIIFDGISLQMHELFHQQDPSSPASDLTLGAIFELLSLILDTPISLSIK